MDSSPITTRRGTGVSEILGSKQGLSAVPQDSRFSVVLGLRAKPCHPLVSTRPLIGYPGERWNQQLPAHRRVDLEVVPILQHHFDFRWLPAIDDIHRNTRVLVEPGRTQGIAAGPDVFIGA